MWRGTCLVREGPSRARAGGEGGALLRRAGTGTRARAMRVAAENATRRGRGVRWLGGLTWQDVPIVAHNELGRARARRQLANVDGTTRFLPVPEVLRPEGAVELSTCAAGGWHACVRKKKCPAPPPSPPTSPPRVPPSTGIAGVAGASAAGEDAWGPSRAAATPPPDPGTRAAGPALLAPCHKCGIARWAGRGRSARARGARPGRGAASGGVRGGGPRARDG